MAGTLYLYILYAGKQVHVAQSDLLLRVGEIMRNGLLGRCELITLAWKYDIKRSRMFLSDLLPHFECLSTDISVCIRSFVPYFSNGTGRDVPSRVLVTPHMHMV